jgi:NADH-quinone oxidoreductase subunit M
VYSSCFLVVMLSSVGLPGLNGFVGEFLILLGTFHTHPRLAAVAVSGVVLGAVYMLWMYQRVIFGALSNPANERLADLSGREALVLAPILALIVVMGVYPGPFLRVSEAAIELSLERVQARIGGRDPGDRNGPTAVQSARRADAQGLSELATLEYTGAARREATSR